MLERDEHGHQLGHARGRPRDVGRARRENDRVGAAADDVGRGNDGRGRSDGGGTPDRQRDHRERKKTATHHTGM